MLEGQNVAITFDSWTSTATKSYIGVTGHILDDHMQHCNALIALRKNCESHTIINLVDFIRVKNDLFLVDNQYVFVLIIGLLGVVI
jgi:hypothetical protein